MTTDLATALDQTPIHAATTADLKAELARSLEITARHLTHVAAIWNELEHRGEDMSHLRSGLWAYMPLIARGKLRAEIVVQYAGHTMLLRRLADLPTEDQDTLLRDQTVLVVDHIDGAWHERRVPITRLRAQEIAQVIGDRIRPPDEQRRAALSRSRTNPPAKRAPAPTALANAASSLPKRQSGAAPIQLALRLTPAQLAAFEHTCTTHGLSPAKLATAALIVAGAIPRGDA